jgi:uncharacterized protein (DUF2235 family)
LDPDKFPYTARNPSIATIRHAVSVDERRWFFRQNLMYKAAGNVTGQNTGQDLYQAWFPGVHCDVGGGYPEIFSTNPEVYSGIWREPFVWMVNEATQAGLVTDPKRLSRILGRTPPCDFPWKEAQHESLTPAWWPAEYFPKRVWQSSQQSLQWQIGKGRHRTIPDGALIHRSTLQRIRDTSYSPPNFPEAFLGKVRKLAAVPDSLPFESGQ